MDEGDKNYAQAMLNSANEYLNQMKGIIDSGQYFVLAEVKKNYDDLVRVMKREEVFSSEQIDELDKRFNSIADSRVLEHLVENFC